MKYIETFAALHYFLGLLTFCRLRVPFFDYFAVKFRRVLDIILHLFLVISKTNMGKKSLFFNEQELNICVTQVLRKLIIR